MLQPPADVPFASFLFLFTLQNSKGSVEVAAKCFYRRKDLPSNLLVAADRHACMWGTSWVGGCLGGKGCSPYILILLLIHNSWNMCAAFLIHISCSFSHWFVGSPNVKLPHILHVSTRHQLSAFPIPHTRSLTLLPSCLSPFPLSPFPPPPFFLHPFIFCPSLPQWQWRKKMSWTHPCQVGTTLISSRSWRDTSSGTESSSSPDRLRPTR